MEDYKLELQVQMNEQQYVKTAVKLAFKRMVTKFMIGFGLFAIFMSIISIITLDIAFSDTIPQLVLGVFFAVLYPLIIYFGAKSMFKKNTRISEPKTITITDKEIHVKGQTYETSLDLSPNNFKKAVDVNEFILLQADVNNYIFLPKKSFSSQNEINEFKEFLRGKGLKTFK